MTFSPPPPPPPPPRADGATQSQSRPYSMATAAAEKDGSTISEQPVMDDISPTSSPRPAVVSEEVEEGLPRQYHQDAGERMVEHREAMQYWGYLVKDDKCGSEKLNCLLAGIANYISTHFKGPKDCADLTPTQLAAFYRAVGGNYDVLFVETQPSSISFIYKALGCLHSIQPKDESDRHASPTIPALKPRGFVTWQTIQLLLGPEEHVPFLQSALAQFDIVDPSTGQMFPKVLPDEAFPREPDPAMLEWYDEVYEKLQQDMQREPNPGRRSLSLSDASASEQSEEEKFAASYFKNPMFRDPSGRPTVSAGRGSYKSSSRSRGSRQPSLSDRGKTVLNSVPIVRHFMSPPSTSHSSHHHPTPRHSRRGSIPDRYREAGDEEEEYEEVTPTGMPPPTTNLHPDYRAKPPNSRTHPKTPELIDTDSDSDSVHVIKRPPPNRRASSRDQREREQRERDAREQRLQREINDLQRKREWERDRSPAAGSKHDSKSPPLRHRRSHEPAVSPTDYFPRQFYDEDGSRLHSHINNGSAYSGSDTSFGPSKEPSMASRVANISMQHPSLSRTSSPRRIVEEPRVSAGGAGSYPPRGGGSSGPEERGSYNGRPTVRYSRRSIDEDRKREQRERERDRDRDRDRERERDRDRDRDRERERERERERPRYGGRGSDEYLGDRGLRADTSSARSRSYDPDGDRLRQSTRYVEGANGRRYPTKAPWQ